MKRLTLLSFLLLSGCMNGVPNNLPEVVTALGKDQASFGISIQSPWATVVFCRSNSSGAEFSCGPLILKNGATSPTPLILWPGTGPKPQLITPQ